MTATPNCAAAEGLAGSNLFCINFSSVSDQTLAAPLPQPLNLWSFGKDSMNNDCWQVKGGELQIVNFSGFADTCTFKMPAVTNYGQFSSFTLAIVQTLNINSNINSNAVTQTASVSNGVMQNVLWSATGKYPQQTISINVNKTALPGAGAYQPLFQITSSVSGGGFTGWLIDSIAVNGNP